MLGHNLCINALCLKHWTTQMQNWWSATTRDTRQRLTIIKVLVWLILRFKRFDSLLLGLACSLNGADADRTKLVTMKGLVIVQGPHQC